MIEGSKGATEEITHPKDICKGAVDDLRLKKQGVNRGGKTCGGRCLGVEPGFDDLKVS